MERQTFRRKLITSVRKHTILWNKQTNRNICNKEPLKTKAWQEIAEELGAEADKLQLTWKMLRDLYRQDLKRERKHGLKPKWRYFHDMDFLRNIVQRKESQNEHTDSDSESDVNEQKQQLNHTQCSNITTNLTRATITTRSNSINLQATKPPLPFLPIILTKQWQGSNEEIPSQQTDDLISNQQSESYKTNEANCDPTQTTVVYSSKCESSKNFKTQPHLPATEPVMHEQDPELGLIIESPSATSHSVREFQETSVSTSCDKRNRFAYEDSDTTTDTVAKRSRSADNDFDVKDDAYYFVMSLLPSLRQISNKQKFPLRMGIMNLIAKDLEDQC